MSGMAQMNWEDFYLVNNEDENNDIFAFSDLTTFSMQKEGGPCGDDCRFY